MATGSASSTGQYISTDRETIRKWADRHNAVPVRGRPDSLDLVHESRVDEADERLDWEAFYEELEHGGHAVSYRVDGLETPGVITHDQAASRSDVADKQIRDRLVAGETVTNTIQETSAVETPIIEEATVESELVDREIIHEELLRVDLVERTCTDFVIVSSDDFVDADTFDHDRYFAALDASRANGETPADESTVEPSLPYTTDDAYRARIDVREVWRPSREVTERFTVESRITGTGVTEAATLDEYDLDVTGLQRSIVEQGMLDVDHEPGEVMRDFEIESQLAEGDQIHTTFTRTSVVEDEVIDQMRLYADMDEAEFAEMDFTASDHVVSEEATETLRSETSGTTLTSDDVGKDVVDATGNIVGTIGEVTDGGQTASVEPHSSITDRITAALGSTDDDAHDMAVHTGQLAAVTDDEVQLQKYEQLAEDRAGEHD